MSEATPQAGEGDSANDRTLGNEIATAKRRAREQARSARAALTDAERASASQRIAEAALALPELTDVRLVLAYGANAEEVDTAPLASALRARGVEIAFPRVEAPGVLGLHLMTEGVSLERGSFGILEPPKSAPRIAPESLDAVIVPGVAYGPNGTRLGYGGGFYDRLLPTLRQDCARIGVCFDEQLLEDLPSEPHDATVDVLVTPTRVIRPGERTEP